MAAHENRPVWLFLLVMYCFDALTAYASDSSEKQVAGPAENGQAYANDAALGGDWVRDQPCLRNSHVRTRFWKSASSGMCRAPFT